MMYSRPQQGTRSALQGSRHEGRHTKRVLGPKVRLKHHYRIKARDAKGRTVRFSTRTKQPESTIQRMLTLKGLELDRIRR